MFGHVKGAFTGAASNKEGLFESASGGTIFLDEISSMPASIQAKLLRVLQDRQVRKVGGNESVAVDVRVIAATNDRLERLIEEQKFREDLYYRLSVIPIELAPLRNRREDILPMVNHVLRREVRDHTNLPKVDAETQEILEKYAWPGNVRELENAVRHALTFAREGIITKEVLPAKILNSIATGGSALPALAEDMKGKSLKAFLRAKEREYLAQVLAGFGGDKEQAAKALRISLATLYRKLPEQE